MNYHELFGRMMEAVKPDWEHPATARVVSICAKVASELSESKIRHLGNEMGANSECYPAPKPAFRKKTHGGGKEIVSDPMKTAYMAEHPNIQPAQPVRQRKDLCASEQRFYDYVQAHPGASKPAIQNALGISQANYYWLKKQCIKKGWLSDNGAIVGLKIGSDNE